METKKYIDVKDLDKGREKPIARKTLLAFYNMLSISKHFKHVTWVEFHKIM